MDKQIIPPQLLEKVHSVMNYLSCFGSDMQLDEYITAEELYVALENMNKNQKFDDLINYVACLFIKAIFKDIKMKNLHQDYLCYEYNHEIIRSMRTCFKQIDDHLQTFMKMWRQYLGFFLLVKPFRKSYLIENYIASSTAINRRNSNDEDEEDDDEEENNDGNGDDVKNSQTSSKVKNGNLDESDGDEKDEVDGKQKEKKKDISSDDQLYEHYKCRAISDTDILFADFSTSEKLEAFAILVKIGYKLPFCQAYYSQKFKNILKEDEMKTMKKNQTEKEAERDEVNKQVEEQEKIVQEYLDSVQGDNTLLSVEKNQLYKKEKAKLNSMQLKYERLEKAIQKQNAELTLMRRQQFFQLSNWVSLGKDRNKNNFYACSYETSSVYKKIFRESDFEGTLKIECNMYQYDNLTNMRLEFNLNNIADDQLWDKINSLVRSGILTIPETKPEIILEDDSNKDDRRSGQNYYKGKAKLIKENLLERQYNFQQQQRISPLFSKSNNKSKSVVIQKQIEDLDTFQFDRRITRGSVGNYKRKTLVIDDSEEEDDDN